MKERSYAVIGLGQFGMTVALTLAEANGDVLAIDENDDKCRIMPSTACCSSRWKAAEHGIRKCRIHLAECRQAEMTTA